MSQPIQKRCTWQERRGHGNPTLKHLGGPVGLQLDRNVKKTQKSEARAQGISHVTVVSPQTTIRGDISPLTPPPPPPPPAQYGRVPLRRRFKFLVISVPNRCIKMVSLSALSICPCTLSPRPRARSVFASSSPSPGVTGMRVLSLYFYLFIYF